MLIFAYLLCWFFATLAWLTENVIFCLNRENISNGLPLARQYPKGHQVLRMIPLVASYSMDDKKQAAVKYFLLMWDNSFHENIQTLDTGPSK